RSAASPNAAGRSANHAPPAFGSARIRPSPRSPTARSTARRGVYQDPGLGICGVSAAPPVLDRRAWGDAPFIAGELYHWLTMQQGELPSLTAIAEQLPHPRPPRRVTSDDIAAALKT